MYSIKKLQLSAANKREAVFFDMLSKCELVSRWVRGSPLSLVSKYLVPNWERARSQHD